MSNYWKRRELVERVRLFNITEEDLRKILRKEYLRIYKEVRQQLVELEASLGPKPMANDLYKEDKFYKLLSEIQYKLDELGNFEKEHMEQTFAQYYINNANLTGTATDLPMDNARVVQAINAAWVGDGQNFSDRIWTSKRKLVERLRTGLIDTVATGRNWGELSKELAKAFGTTYEESRRLVRTELSHIQNESSLDKYETEGVEYVRYVAEPDCCAICQKFNNQVYPIKNAPGIPKNTHVNCRCTYIPVIKV